MGRNKHLKILRKEARKQVSENMILENLPEIRLELERKHTKIRSLYRVIGFLVLVDIIGIIAIVIQILNK